MIIDKALHWAHYIMGKFFLASPDIAEETFNYEIRNSNCGGYNEKIIINSYHAFCYFITKRVSLIQNTIYE